MRGIACGASFTRIVKEVNSPGVFNPRMFNEPATSCGRNDIFCKRELARRVPLASRGLKIAVRRIGSGPWLGVSLKHAADREARFYYSRGTLRVLFAVVLIRTYRSGRSAIAGLYKRPRDASFPRGSQRSGEILGNATAENVDRNCPRYRGKLNFIAAKKTDFASHSACRDVASRGISDFTSRCYNK